MPYTELYICVHLANFVRDLLVNIASNFQKVDLVKPLGFLPFSVPLSCPCLFLNTTTLPTVSCGHPPTIFYTALEIASRVLYSCRLRKLADKK
jgi:hypothetical protein